MEYLVGGDMKSLLAVYGFLGEDVSSMYAAEVTLALEHLHYKGIVHRQVFVQCLHSAVLKGVGAARGGQGGPYKNVYTYHN